MVLVLVMMVVVDEDDDDDDDDDGDGDDGDDGGDEDVNVVVVSVVIVTILACLGNSGLWACARGAVDHSELTRSRTILLVHNLATRVDCEGQLSYCGVWTDPDVPSRLWTHSGRHWSTLFPSREGGGKGAVL